MVADGILWRETVWMIGLILALTLQSTSVPGPPGCAELERELEFLDRLIRANIFADGSRDLAESGSRDALRGFAPELFEPTAPFAIGQAALRADTEAQRERIREDLLVLRLRLGFVRSDVCGASRP